MDFMSTYYEKGRNLPVYSSLDVVVAGGGVAGFAAAVAAARSGAKTLLLERNGVIGGVATSGLMVSWGVKGWFWDAKGEHVVTGIPWELHRRIIEKGGGVVTALKSETAPDKMIFDLEVFKRTAFEMLEQSGVPILFHTFVCDVIMDGGSVKGVVIENKSGRQVVYAKQVIDATGDADICAYAGVEYTKENGMHGNMIRVGGVDKQKTYRALKEKEHLIKTENEHHTKIDTYDHFKDLWQRDHFYLRCASFRNLMVLEPFRGIFQEAIDRGFVTEEMLNYSDDCIKKQQKVKYGFDMQGIEGRVQTDIVDLWGYESVFDGTDAEEISRQQISGYRMAWLFFEQIVKKLPGFENSYILNISTDFGLRRTRVVETRYKMTRDEVLFKGVVFPDTIGRGARFRWWIEEEAKNPPRGYDIPYRQLLPIGVENLYVVGKPLASGLLRAMPICMVTGEGAGTAAALAARHNINSGDINIEELQKELIKKNVNIGKK
jgi:ribulose 1,5-bisphosphate synthetase/thiazole synthase